MKRRALLKQNSLFLALLFWLTGCAAAPEAGDEGLAAKVAQALSADKAVIIYKMVNQARDSEQYADWSAYLNDFYAAHADGYEVYQATDGYVKQRLEGIPNTAESFTLFVKRGKASYFYSGVIVEPMVYEAVHRVYAGEALRPVDRAFMPELVEWVE